MFKLIQKLTAITFITLFVNSCGDLQKNESEQEIKLEQLATCELDPDAFSKVLEESIKSDFLCLKDQLNMFIDLVETDRPGYMSQKVLENFVKTGPMDIGEEILPILDAVYDLSFLILGGEKGYISKKDLEELIDLGIFMNDRMWKIYRFFSSTNEVNFVRHMRERNTVFNDLSLMMHRFTALYNSRREELDRIDLERLVQNIFGTDVELENKIRKLLFVKKVFLGGNINELTNTEIYQLFQKLPFLAEVMFDLVKINQFTFLDDYSLIFKLLMEDIKFLEDSLFYPKDSKVAVMTFEDIFYMIEEFAPDIDINFRDYKRELSVLKEPILGTPGVFVSSQDIFQLVAHAEELLSKGRFFYRVYQFYEDELNLPYQITHDLSTFPLVSEQEQEWLRDFSRIIRDYHFFKGDNLMPTFHHKYYRNPLGVMEIAAMEYALKILMNFFGKATPEARGGVHLTLDETYDVLMLLKYFLKDMGIITVGKEGGGEVYSATENVVLMATLFQYQSDGCGDICMEVPEVTEFFIGLFSAVNVREEFSETMEALCYDELDEYGRFPVECFRRNFINVIDAKMSNGLAISDYMPKMRQFITEMMTAAGNPADPTESSDYVKFLSETEEFTRMCTYYDKEAPNPESVPMTVTDAFAVFAGLINVESTLLRHDLNENNILDGMSKDFDKNEVRKAYYSVYEGAIKGMVAPNGGFMEKLARPIFLYLIKKGRVPDVANFGSIWKFATFLLKTNKRADATRTSIATILKEIGSFTPSSPWKCEECFRDPTVVCEPEGDEWMD